MPSKNGSVFQWQDYLIFSLMLSVSSVIGVFFAVRNVRNKKASSDEMLTGSRTLPALPVALSLVAGFTSSSGLLGIPLEVYTKGGNIWMWIFGFIPCFLITAFFILPIFYRLRMTNAYEYLELRFDKTIRIMGSVGFILIILTYMAAALYGPAVAMSQVTGLSREVSVLAVGLVCTFYTSIGGIRAVIWTDAFQILLVWAGSLAVSFKGASDAGGWIRVLDIASQGGRLPDFNMDPNPFVANTFWAMFIGGGIIHMTIYGSNQANLQRYTSVRTLEGARGALFICLPMWIFYLSVQCLLGFVMYAYFLTCDPLTSGTVSRGDQVVPLFVVETMGQWPGLPGLFVSSIFSAAISTVSSGVNSLAAVTLEDVVKPFYKLKNMALSKRIAYRITVILGVIYGMVTIGLAYLVDVLGETAFMISFNMFGMVGAPVLGLIVNGIFLPFVNSWGAGAGFLTSLAVGLYIGIAPIFNPPPSMNLPLRTDGCLAENVTSVVSSLIATTTATYENMTTLGSPGDEGSSHLYLANQHYSTVALLVSFTITVLVSIISGCNKGRQVDPRTYLKYKWSSVSPEDADQNDVNANGNDAPNVKLLRLKHIAENGFNAA